MKTNALRILDELKISYELREYAVDPADLSAETVARKIGMTPEQVFKTLLCKGDRHGHCFAVIPGNMQLDLKALARLTSDRAVALVALKDVEPLTGYVRGGVTVFGARKAFPTYAHETVELCERIAVSAGIRGTQVLMRPTDYLRASQAKCGAIAIANAPSPFPQSP